MQDETQPSALGLLSPPLQSKHPSPILLPNFSMADTMNAQEGIPPLVELSGREPISPPGFTSCWTHHQKLLIRVFFLARIIIIITGAGLPEKYMSLSHIPRDLVNSSPADAHIFI